MLKQRVITALVMVAVVLTALFFLSSQWFAVFAAVIVLLAAWEWCQFTHWRGPMRIAYVAVIALSLLGLGYGSGLLSAVGDIRSDWVLRTCQTAFFWWALVISLVALYPRQRPWRGRYVQALMGLLVLVPTWLALVFLHAQPRGQWLIVIMAITVICADAGAYFVGRKWGRRKLAPKVSPGKSWEGLVGGFVCSGIFAFILAQAVGGIVENRAVIAMVLGTSLISVYGDLLESMLKRECGIKDSGKLFPGHGGVLDRADSLTAALPIFTLIYLTSGWQL